MNNDLEWPFWAQGLGPGPGGGSRTGPGPRRQAQGPGPGPKGLKPLALVARRILCRPRPLGLLK